MTSPSLQDSGSITHSTKLHLGALAAFTSALFLPWIGRGFIHDDFVHLLSASRDTLHYGLTTATGGPFYAPLAWLTFRFDWLFWGKNPFPMAAENLLLHIGIQFLIYFLVLRLWNSRPAAFWAAFGFALLFPGNIWATLWISTRAHLLTTAFFVAAMLAFLRMRRHHVLPAIAAVGFGCLAIFTKESGITLLGALVLLAIYEHRAGGPGKLPFAQALMVVLALSGAAALYLWFRSSSGAVPFSFSMEDTYTYAPSLRVLWSNSLEYVWRTFGLLTILGGALILSRVLSGSPLDFASLTRDEVLFCIALYVVTISPFILLPFRSGIYPYLPSVAGALLLGAVARSLFQTNPPSRRFHVVAAIPVLLVVGVYTAFIVGQSRKWIHTASTTTVVLNQISAQEPHPQPRTFFVLSYREGDPANRFPGGFETWGFPSALRLHYSEPSLDGKIVREGESWEPQEGVPEVRFEYTSANGEIRVVKK